MLRIKKYITVVLVLCCTLLCSCLNYDKKELRYILNTDGTISLVITYYDLVSDPVLVSGDEDNSDPVAEDDSTLYNDYSILVDDYLNGSEAEDEYRKYKVESKRLFEQNGVLCGEVRFVPLAPEDMQILVDEKNAVMTMIFSKTEATITPLKGRIYEKAKLLLGALADRELSYMQEPIVPGKEGRQSLLPLWKADPSAPK